MFPDIPIFVHAVRIPIYHAVVVALT